MSAPAIGTPTVDDALHYAEDRCNKAVQVIRATLHVLFNGDLNEDKERMVEAALENVMTDLEEVSERALAARHSR